MLLNQLERQLRRLMMHTKHWAVAAMSPTSLSLLYNHTRWLSNKLFWLYRLKEFYHLFDKSYYTFVCTEKKKCRVDVYTYISRLVHYPMPRWSTVDTSVEVPLTASFSILIKSSKGYLHLFLTAPFSQK